MIGVLDHDFECGLHPALIDKAQRFLAANSAAGQTYLSMLALVQTLNSTAEIASPKRRKRKTPPPKFKI